MPLADGGSLAYNAGVSVNRNQRTNNGVFNLSAAPSSGRASVIIASGGFVLPAYNERRPFQFALFSCHLPYTRSFLFRTHTEARNLKMWDFLGTSLRPHSAGIDIVIVGDDQFYTLTLGSKSLNRHHKCAKDAADWLPKMTGAGMLTKLSRCVASTG